MTEPTQRLRKAERHERILMELRLRSHLRISDLARDFGVATETIRRDVAELEAGGRVAKAFGGVTPVAPGQRPDVDSRSRDRQKERAEIARQAAALVQPGDTIMLDAGSTAQELARYLSLGGQPVTVLTNSLNVAIILGSSEAASVRLCPGDLLAREAAVTGSETVEFLRRFHVGRAFIGASAISRNGITEAVPGFAAVKRAMMGQCAELVVMADQSKIGRTDTDLVTRFGPGLTLVTEAALPQEIRRALDDGGARVL
ncbi:DeoR/GlpR family DNA-binding transcription regulator [Poseidonocella sp. HB161398]|uniref:DeoR/GlpR family DNA-binding transcription regulator n=1 Tax=Poseidonocella sp. HB161398 TaxID=2320855 RepID=UPI0011082006|nr:DeoR/GlpR family DNA-binding transcription regulator [Poseidonocella sp. HB161398]